jgi:hypothetical protein
MKSFNYGVAINQLKLGKKTKINDKIKYELIPSWVQGEDFLQLFLPFLKIIGDSREQDKWVETACKYYGISFEWAKKDKASKTENLKEGDYTFKVSFENLEFDYTGVVAYERKGSVAEFYGNCTGQNKAKNTSERDRIRREFDRFNQKKYKKVVLLLEFGEQITDLISLKFNFRGENGTVQTKDTKHTLYSTVMSWKQPNNKDFDIIQSNSHEKLFWLFLQDCFYYFRNEIRNICIEKNIIEKGEENAERNKKN